MKANAPEKIYIDVSLDSAWGMTERSYDNEVEYTRTDAFIEKACDWFRTLDDKEPPYKTTEEFIEGFKKAMAI